MCLTMIIRIRDHCLIRIFLISRRNPIVVNHNGRSLKTPEILWRFPWLLLSIKIEAFDLKSKIIGCHLPKTRGILDFRNFYPPPRKIAWSTFIRISKDKAKRILISLRDLLTIKNSRNTLKISKLKRDRNRPQ